MSEVYSRGGMASGAGEGDAARESALALLFQKGMRAETALRTLRRRPAGACGVDESEELVGTWSSWHSSSRAGRRVLDCWSCVNEAFGSRATWRRPWLEGIRLIPMLDWRRPMLGRERCAVGGEFLFGAELLLARLGVFAGLP